MVVPVAGDPPADTAAGEIALTRFAGFGGLCDAERAALIAMAGPAQELERGAFLVDEGAADHGCYLLLQGWSASAISFADGGRAIVKVHMPGDMLGGPSMSLTRSAESIVALTRCAVIRLTLEGIGSLFEAHPRLAAMLLLIAQEERVMLMDRLAAGARGNALVNIAFLLVQLHGRASRSLGVDAAGFDLPLSQADFADLAGLTTTHTNRVLKRLRQDGIVEWSRGRVNIRKVEELRRLAGLPDRVLSREPYWLPKARTDQGAIAS